eukprot:1136151-Pelagomonas_calceolata.AAC.2
MLELSYCKHGLRSSSAIDMFLSNKTVDKEELCDSLATIRPFASARTYQLHPGHSLNCAGLGSIQVISGHLLMSTGPYMNSSWSSCGPHFSTCEDINVTWKD